MKRWSWVWALSAVFGAGLLAYGEDITLATYYPSPRGVYDELRANRLILTDQKTKQDYVLTMEDGRLLLTDSKNRKAFVVVDVSGELPR